MLFLGETLLRYDLVQHIRERPDSGIRCHVTVQNLLGIGRLAIHLMVHVFVHVENRAIQRNAREEALRARIRVDCRFQIGIHSGLSLAADGPGNDTGVDTELQVSSACEQAKRVAVGEDQNEIG